MARYIDTSKATIPKGFFDDLNVPKLLGWLNSQPAADVVPKSEAENYKKTAEQQQTVAMDRYFKIKRFKEELAKAKIEVEKAKKAVAGEIFEEIEKRKVIMGCPAKIIAFRYSSSKRGFEEYVIEGDIVAFSDIAELKKKYTERKEDEGK